MKNLFLMMGCPGSGKTTFINNYVRNLNTVIVSRDTIRFSLLKDGENYFTHEEQVVKILWKMINEALANNHDVFVDQTSLTKKSRKWLIDHVENYNKIYIIWIDESLETCLERNELRKGTKAYVPRGAIRRMHEQIEPPSKAEGFDYIYHYSSKNCLLERIDEDE